MHKKSPRSYPLVDGLALLVGFVQPIMTIPQILTVIQAGDASQISWITWLTYDIASIILLTYGIAHRLMPIIVAQALWLVVQTVMIVLTIIY